MVDVQTLHVAISNQTLASPLSTNTALLVATERCFRSWLLEAVDEDGAGFELLADEAGARYVCGPHAGAEAGVSVIRAGDYFVLVGSGLGWNNGSKWFLNNNPRIIRRIINDGRRDEESLLPLRQLPSSHILPPLTLTFLKEALHALKLHIILDRAQHHTFLIASNLQCSSEISHSLDHWRVDVFVDIALVFLA